jgi:hypothetical protein
VAQEILPQIPDLRSVAFGQYLDNAISQLCDGPKQPEGGPFGSGPACLPERKSAHIAPGPDGTSSQFSPHQLRSASESVATPLPGRSEAARVES